MEEVKYVAFMPTNSWEQVIAKICNTSNIISLLAYRGIDYKQDSKRTVLPFCRLRTTLHKHLDINFLGRDKMRKMHVYGTFPVEQFNKFLLDEHLVDIQISKLGLICESKELWELLAPFSKRQPIADKEKFCVVDFKTNDRVTVNPYIRRAVIEEMKDKILKLHFKAAVLDLISIVTYPDWKSNYQNPLLPQLEQDKKILRDILDNIFMNAKIKVRAYKLTEGRRWELLDVEDL